MKGSVTYYSKEEGKGAIQTEDGRMFSFKREDFASGMDDTLFYTGQTAEFDSFEDKAVQVKALNLDEPKTFNFYLEPKEINVYTSSEVENYELIDKSAHRLSKVARNPDELKSYFTELCKSLGGNAVLDYEDSKFIRNSIGFSYYLYRGFASFGVLGIRSESSNDNALSYNDLRHRLNHERVEKMALDEKKSKTSLKVLKIAGIVLLIIFSIGFFMSE